MYKKRSIAEIRKELKATSEKMAKDVEEYTNSPGDVKEMLDFMSQFHQYSFRNQVMIRSQRPGASAVGSFKKFKDLGYSVRKGERGLRIWAPSQVSVYQFRNDAGMLISIPSAKVDERIKGLVKEGKAIKKTGMQFRLVSVFDATQTDMPVKDYPKLYPNRPMDYTADPKLVKELAAATKQWVRDTGVSEVKLENITAVSAYKGVKDEGEKGFSTPRADHQLIAIRDSLPESDKIAVRIHEMAHNALHGDKRSGKTKAEKEFQAEMTSYVVCKHFGLDTAENATQYIASWTKEDKGFQALSVKERGALLSDVQKTAKGFIDDISEQLAQGRNREQVRAKQQARGLELE